jgi:hypothetical protein
VSLGLRHFAQTASIAERTGEFFHAEDPIHFLPIKLSSSIEAMPRSRLVRNAR